MEQRYFYHSFPRRSSDGSDKGLRILTSILDSGILLTPERLEFRERRSDGQLSKPYTVYQKRACFTELAPSELPAHAKVFGRFAIEWDLRALRQLGACPVFYVPLQTTPETLEGVAPALLARIAEVQELLTRLERVKHVASACQNPLEVLRLTRNAQDVGATRCTVGAASDLISFLELETEPVESLLASVRALAGYFYPTEDFQYTGELAYYRQREWRILANMVYEGVPVTSEPTDDEKAVLLGIDEEFFVRTMTFPTGEYRLVDQCHYLRGIGGGSVGATIRRVIAPQAQLEQVAAIASSRSLDIDVISLEELA